MYLKVIVRSWSSVMVVHIVMTAFSTSSSAQTETVSGAPVAKHIEPWKGTLDLGVKLELGLKIYREADGKLSAKLDSYTQSALGIPLEFQREGDRYSFSSKALGISYEATLNADKSVLKGTFKQGPVTAEVDFEKADLNHEVKQNRPQTPKAPYPYLSSDVTVENKKDNLSLAGTLTILNGNGPFPAAILITRSGPHDRDDDLLGHRPFLVIADHLTRQGITVLRFDDRGVGASKGNHASATSEDFADDVRSAIEFLKLHPKVDSTKIGLIGHSEGGLIAPMIAAQRSDVAFIVLMAAPGVRGANILESQTIAVLQAAGEPPQMVTANQKVMAAVLD